MVELGYIHFLNEMKQYNTNFQFEDFNNRTPLHIAAREGHLDIVEFLVDNNVDIN